MLYTGKALASAENAMYYSEVYGAWSWLVITDGTNFNTYYSVAEIKKYISSL